MTKNVALDAEDANRFVERNLKNLALCFKGLKSHASESQLIFSPDIEGCPWAQL